MTDWVILSDACGSAEHVPELLDRFEADPSGVWSELMDHLCPQLDTAFSASFAALPRLAEIATACAPEHFPGVLLAAGAIAGCAPSEAEGTGPLRSYAPAIDVLRALTDACLSRTSETEEYVYLLQALLSFDGVEGWDRCLEGLHTGEYEVDCPYCGVELFIVIQDGDPFCCSEDYSVDGVVKSPLRPVGPDRLEGVARRLYERALADGQERVAAGLPYLFGRAECPDCGTEFPVGERAVAGWVA